tara:strand:- start:25167 stop:25892 length:726 start_codon:yes stop_codon:yes gene_type:complete
MKILIVDADSIIYKICWTNQESSWETVKKAADDYLNEIFQNTSSTHYILCLTLGKCFRYNIAKTKPYKGHRKTDKPKYFDQLREYFITEHKAFFYRDQYEADDLIFILKNQYEEKYPDADIILGVNDKDCLQYEGTYYDYHKKVEIYLNNEDSNMNFLMQMLQGDTSDNINILEGIGPKTAAKILAVDGDIVQVFNQFFIHFGQDIAIDKFYEAYKLIRMITKDNDIVAPELLLTNIKEDD